MDHKKFCFALAKPTPDLNASKIAEIEKLSHLYAQGGSRRDFMSNETEANQEPVLAILRACGVQLHELDSSKQPLDPGSICHLLFSPEGRQPDNSSNELKSNFTPVPAVQDSIKSTTQTNNIENTSEFLLSSWGQTPPTAEVAASSTRFRKLTDELAKKKPQQDDPLALLQKEVEGEAETGTEKSSEAKTSIKDEVYQHITDAISGLLGQEPEPKKSDEIDRSAKWVADQIESRREKIEQKRSIERPIQDEEKSPEPETFREPEPIPEPDLKNSAPVDFALLDVVSINTEPIVFPAIDTVPAKLDDFQEPKVVMNEMASLMNKLESQVARAAKKLTSKTASIEEQLISGMSAILSTTTQENKDTEAQLVIHGDSISKQFEALFESLKTEIAEKSASAREDIQASRDGQQKLIEENEQEHHVSLTDALEHNQNQFAQLVQEQEHKLKNMFKEEAEKLQRQLTEINSDLQQMADQFVQNLSEQLHSFETRDDDEMAIIIENLNSNTNLLSKEMTIAEQQSLERLKNVKEEFEASLKHLLDTTEVALIRQIRLAQIDFFLPRLKNHRQVLETMMQEMEQTFAEKLLSQSQSQLEGLTNSLDSARSQLHSLRDECLTKLDLIGRNQQSGLEELFSSASNSLVQNTETLVRLLKQAEQEITDTNAICKKLAETYSLDNDPAVTSLRQNITNRVDGLKSQVKNELESSVNNDCAALEELIRNQHNILNTRRAELAQRVHFASDHGLQRIRAAIHDAFNAIQSERETYME